jgi:hypothetical protein
MNTYVRDNISFLGATGFQTINTTGVIFPSNSGFGDLASGGVGPTVAVNTGANALVTLTALLEPSVDGDTVSMGFNVSGATTIAASVSQCLSNSEQAPMQISAAFVVSSLNPGSNTFTCKYECLSCALTAAQRNLIVMPLP